MLEVLQTSEFWITLAVVAVILLGTEALKKHLKRIAFGCDKKSVKKE